MGCGKLTFVNGVLVGHRSSIVSGSLSCSYNRLIHKKASKIHRIPNVIRCCDSKSEKSDDGSTTVKDGKNNNSESNSVARQLLGMKGASEETNLLKIRLQLTKPVTWVPLIWGVTCGAAASGQFHWSDPQDILKAIVCMIMSGPLLTGYTQTINDWYDRDIDAINEPYRPIPSGRITEGQVKAQIAVLLGGGLATAYGLDVWSQHETPWILLTAIFGSFISYIYSAPPLKLKQNGWLGNYALGASYISLPWWAGQLVFGSLEWKTMVLTMFYSLAGLGIAIVNDFKSIEGDRKMGLKSLPVEFGVDTAKWICVGTIDVFQALVACVLFAIGETPYAAALVALIVPQMVLQQKYFLKDPIENDVKYQASAQPFLVLGILVTGLAIGNHGPL
uniref:Chlorophyll synthase n=1 Tax=Timspurckia oligopyrenoides TaxID=708627 RepID=A0A6T6MCL3_9RHOD|mmetsp:Transcript_11508/g.20799  ORF Transcript_11508/g.20799 Transcript_11508/m.20799 type:complete len:390 (+) Transcript_11508:49-1218(+)